MTDLYPTPTRLQLLASVGGGVVYREYVSDWEGRTRTDRLRVNARLAELEQAGWVELEHGSPGQRRNWRLTPAGARTLARGRGHA